MMRLNADSFEVVGRGKAVHIKVAGSVLVFFKAADDPGCKQFEPIFANLSKIDHRVTYASIDIAIHREIVSMTRTTSTPVHSVPHLILYVNGAPSVRMNASSDINRLRKFIDEGLKVEPEEKSTSKFMPSNMYTGHQSEKTGKNRYYQLDIQEPKKTSGIKGGGGTGGVNRPLPDDEDMCIAVPEDFIPYNAPWEADKRND
jgi:thioredoxin family protein